MTNGVGQATANILGMLGTVPTQQTAGTIESADQLGTAARTMYDNMVRRNSSGNRASFADTISKALNDGRITEAEADFILSALGF